MRVVVRKMRKGISCCSGHEMYKKNKDSCCCGGHEMKEVHKDSCGCGGHEMHEGHRDSGCCGGDEMRHKHKSSCGCGGNEFHEEHKYECSCGEQKQDLSSRFVFLGTCGQESHEAFQNVKLAIKEMGFADEVKGVGNAAEVAKYGIDKTPALVVDNQVVSVGRALSVDDVKRIFEKKDIKPR